MGKVTVSVPAAIPDLGVGQHSLSLAVGMFMTIQMSESSPGLMVHLDGEGFMSMSSSAAHPIIQGARIVFRTKQLAPDGLQVSVHNEIPLDIGLPVEDVALLAGIVAGNVVIGSPLNRAQILELALEYAQQPFLMATLYDGGLRAFQNVAGRAIDAGLPIGSFEIGILFIPGTVPSALRAPSSSHDAGRSLLLTKALSVSDFSLCRRVVADLPYSLPIQQALESAYEVADCVLLPVGSGPAWIVLAADHIEDAISQFVETIADITGYEMHTRIGSADTQGVTVGEVGEFQARLNRPTPLEPNPVQLSDVTLIKRKSTVEDFSA